MIDHKAGGNRVVLGDPVPWFSAPIVTGGSFDLHVSAGRWVVLSFLGSSGKSAGHGRDRRTRARQFFAR